MQKINFRNQVPRWHIFVHVDGSSISKELLQNMFQFYSSRITRVVQLFRYSTFVDLVLSRHFEKSETDSGLLDSWTLDFGLFASNFAR